MNYLHDCSYGSPYLLGFRESIRLCYFCATPKCGEIVRVFVRGLFRRL